jgi:hypothetical protein
VYTIVTRDGAVFRGELVEKVPGQQVTLRLATGEYRRVRWDYISQLNSGASEPPSLVHVFFRAAEPDAVLQKLDAAGNWFNVCQTPCAGKVSARGTYRVGGEDIRESAPFRLRSKTGVVGVDATRVGTTGRTTWGSVLTIGGGAAAYIGLIVLSVNALPDNDGYYDSNDSNDWSDDDRRDAQWTGFILMLGGGAAGIVGLVTLIRNKTEVRVVDLRRRASSTDFLNPGLRSSERPGFSIPLGKGFSLTERGLAF